MKLDVTFTMDPEQLDMLLKLYQNQQRQHASLKGRVKKLEKAIAP